MQNIKNTPIGLIGLGAMGKGMAESLRNAGYLVYVYDVRPEVSAEFAAAGGVACTSPAEVAKHCQTVISVVVNAEQTEQVLFGVGGTSVAHDQTDPNAAAFSMKKGSVFVMCSTVNPAWSVSLEKKLSDMGILYLDAPISGGAAKAKSGQITMMTSGSEEAYLVCEHALNSMSAKVYKLGDKAGAGSKVKVINQLLAGVHIAAAAEAMALGIREGVNPESLYEVITHSAGNSWMFENRMPHVINADYTPLSAVDIFVKDLGLVLDMARSTKFPLPLSSTAHQMFMQASSAGFAKEDDSAVIKIFPGIELPKPQQKK